MTRILAAALGLALLAPSSAHGQIVDPRIVAVLDEVSSERLHEYLEALTDFETRHSLSFRTGPTSACCRPVTTSSRRCEGSATV